MFLSAVASLQTRIFSKAYAHFLLAIIVGFYLFNGVTYLRYQTLTSDEADFYNYAVRYLKGRPDRTNPSADNSKMPIVALNTLPRIAEQLFYSQQTKQDGGFSDIMHGRYLTLIVSIFTILLVFRWGSELYGQKSGLFAALLFSLCPNHLANAGLVTTDAYSVLSLTTTFYYLWRFCKWGRNADFLLLSIMTGVSQLVKQSLFHLYILVPVCIGIYYVACGKRSNLKKFASNIILFLFLNWLIINMGFYFYHTGQPLGDYKFISTLFRKVQSSLPAWVSVPFPRPFVEGLDQSKYYDQIGGGFPYSSFGKVTILGNASTGGSFWYYFFVSVLFKTPLPFLLLFGWALWLRVRGSTLLRSDVFFLLVPVCYYLILFSFFYKTQVGIRHAIFIYPFLYIFSAQVLVRLRTSVSKAVVALFSIWALASVLAYWKNYYPYTNELILNKTKAYQVVGAGNLEFLQGGNFLKQYLRQHTGVQLVPKTPQKGVFAISLREYMDVWNRHEYDWIRRYPPIGTISCTYLLIKVDKASYDDQR